MMDTDGLTAVYPSPARIDTERERCSSKLIGIAKSTYRLILARFPHYLCFYLTSPKSHSPYLGIQTRAPKKHRCGDFLSIDLHQQIHMCQLIKYPDIHGICFLTAKRRNNMTYLLTSINHHPRNPSEFYKRHPNG